MTHNRIYTLHNMSEPEYKVKPLICKGHALEVILLLTPFLRLSHLGLVWTSSSSLVFTVFTSTGWILFLLYSFAASPRCLINLFSGYLASRFSLSNALPTLPTRHFFLHSGHEKLAVLMTPPSAGCFPPTHWRKASVRRQERHKLCWHGSIRGESKGSIHIWQLRSVSLSLIVTVSSANAIVCCWSNFSKLDSLCNC